MTIPQQFSKEVAEFPAALRQLLEAELAAGNAITEVGHGFPAVPCGAYIILARPVTTRPREDGAGLSFYDRNGSTYSGEFTDEKRHFFVLEPPHPPEPEPDIDAIRAARNAAAASVPAPPKRKPPKRRSTPARVTAGEQKVSSPPSRDPNSALGRFEASRVMDFDKWHDGTGYDLVALRELSPAERKGVETSLIASGARNWRDIEALAALDTPTAREALRAAINDPDPEVRNAATRFAPHIISAAARTASLVAALESAEIYGGLTQTLLEVEAHHPPEVIEALLRGALDREGDVACHFAARLFFLHGKASSAFDMKHRPFFLRFNTTDRPAREAVFCELCAKIGVDPAKFLGRAKPAAQERSPS